jgi:hypothetical protein
MSHEFKVKKELLELEDDIKIFLTERFKRFNRSTGLTVQDVHFDFDPVTFFAKGGKRHILSNVKLKIGV